MPSANLTLRKVPQGVSDDVALFAGDVMGTGYHAVQEAAIRPGDSVAVLGLKALGIRTGHANVIGHVDRVLGMLASGALDPRPLVTHHMSLEDAPEAYAVYDRREALKIVLTP